MKSRQLICVVATMLGLMAVPLQLAAQGTHHHYKLIDMGTFGGPESYINGYEYFGPLQNINNAGTITGWADTSNVDPYGRSSNGYEHFCFNYDGIPCYASHAFLWQDGVRTDLGTLPHGVNSATAWVSSNGLIAGTSQNGETDPLAPGTPTNFPVNHAVMWRDGKIIDLGTLPGGYESIGQAVNSRGQVVGFATNTVPDNYSFIQTSAIFNRFEPYPYPYQDRAFLWQDGVMTDLGTLGNGTDAWATAINDQGQVIGFSYTNQTPNQVTNPCAFGGALIPTQDPFLWENGTMIDLGTLGGVCGFPFGLDNYGRVVGTSDLAGDQVQHPFLWTKAKGMQDLGSLGGSAVATMINDSGEVVGQSSLENSEFHAFLWNGKMHDLGAINGCASAFAINSSGQVVGNWGSNGCNQGAFLWENGGPMVDLATLVSPPTDITLGAVNINDRGEIAGHGQEPSGYGHEILLIPCDENHPNVQGCDYSLVETSTSGPRADPSLRSGSQRPPLSRWLIPNRNADRATSRAD